MLIWDTQSALNGFYGGLLIGLAVAIYRIMNGKIAGISGILGGLLNQKPDNVMGRIALIIGLIIAPFIYSLFQPLPVVTLTASTPMIIVAGLLVGFGTQLGNGCTSGHGVCGISRLSLRSIIATMTFMLSGIMTVLIVKLFF